LEFQFDGPIALRKGDVVKITSAYPDADFGPREISRLINETAQASYKTQKEGRMSLDMPSELAVSITGKVVSSNINGMVTQFTLEEVK
jgi:hypothetical protein